MLLNCVMEGMHDLKLQNKSRLDMGKGFRDETEKNNHLYLLLFQAFLYSALYHYGGMQYNCRSPTRGYIFRRSLTKKGHFDEYSFPSMFNSPEKLVKLFMLLIFCATLQFQSFTENIAQTVTKHMALLVFRDSQRAD